ncbi:MAG: Calx-beta domain-containing protein, partial [Acidimicrobiia bacterium]
MGSPAPLGAKPGVLAVAQTTNGTADAGSATVITVSAGEEIQLPITQEELAAATLEVVGDDLKITLADGRTFLLVGFVDAFDGVPPTFVTEGGAAVGAEELLAQLGQSLEDIQAAAGGAQAGTTAPNQQASFTPGPQQGLIGDLQDEGPVDPTALQYGLFEPLDEPLDFVEDDGSLPPLEWSIIPDGSVQEGEPVTYTVFYTGGTIQGGETILVTVNANNGGEPNGATENEDFTDLATVLTFTSGVTAQTVSVQTTDDTVLENNETYNVTIGVDPSRNHIVDGTADTTIVDQDQQTLQWRVDPDSSVIEGQAATYTVSYTGGTIDDNVTVLVTVNANNGAEPNGATENVDFTDLSTILTFTAGTTAQTVSIQTTDDTILENAETYNVTIAVSANQGQVADGTADTTIIDQDQQTLQWRIDPAESVIEGAAATYTVSYTGGTIDDNVTVLVTVNANNGSEPNGATENVDFTDLQTVLTFTAGTTAQTVSVQTTDDTVLENAETYNVTIAVSANQGTVVDGTADTTIVDQDQQTLQWRIDPDSSVFEGGAATYTVSYTGGTIDNDVTVLVTVNANSGAEPNGATEGQDFTDLQTVLSFTAGVTAQTVSVQTTDDTVLENAETYNVTIEVSGSQGQIADGTADTTIVDGDSNTLQWRIDPDSEVTEGQAATYTVSYTGGSIDDNVTVLVTVNANNGGEPNGATEGEDFTDLQTVLTFTAGTTAQTVSVQTTDDTVLENAETYNVTIDVSPAHGLISDGTADTTIVDQDQQTLQWRIDPAESVQEGAAATYTVSYTGGTIDNDVT